MAEGKKKKAGILGFILMVLCYLLLCWPGILLFDRPGPLVLGMPPMLWGIYLGVLIVVGCMVLLYTLGVEK